MVVAKVHGKSDDTAHDAACEMMVFFKAQGMALGMANGTTYAPARGKAYAMVDAMVQGMAQGTARTMEEGTAQADVLRIAQVKAQGMALDTAVDHLGIIQQLFKLNGRGLL